MENQHRKISGYRELSQLEINLMNEIKSFGPKLLALCESIDEHITAQCDKAWTSENEDEVERLTKADPGNWLVQAKLNLQQGLMALTRSIAQPTLF